MKFDVLIVGGGIVGLATAYQILKRDENKQVVVLEKESEVAAHQTGHNSGVIHSGIYYKPGSLKAKNCIDGYHLLLDFCKTEGVDFELCGKIIVATSSEEIPRLEQLYQRGIENGLEGLCYLSPEEILEKEPHVNGLKGIWVPQTGIVNYKAICIKLKEAIQNMGGCIELDNEVKSIDHVEGGLEVLSKRKFYRTKMLINCAGLFSDKVALMERKEIDTRIIPFRGEYFELTPEAQHLVKGLIYPVPDPAFPFLGVHFTKMIEGGVEAGPNAVFAFKREGYKRTDFNFSDFTGSLSWPGFQKVMYKYWRTGLGEMYRSFSKSAFTKALQKLIPEIKESDLVEAEAGVRAQACDKSGGLLDDFKIIQEKNVVHVINAPSPAATSSLSIGKTLADMVS